MRHDEMNPIKTAKQYGMVASVLSGRSKTISQQLAEDMMNKTPQHSRSKFARELAKKRDNPNYEGFTRLNDFLGVYNGKVYSIYEDTERIQGVPLKKRGAWGDTDVYYSEDYEWKRAYQHKVHDAIEVTVPWAGGTEKFYYYSTDTLKTLVEKPKKEPKIKTASKDNKYKGYFYKRVSTSFGQKYLAAKDKDNLKDGEEDFKAKDKDYLFHLIDEYGENTNNPKHRRNSFSSHDADLETAMEVSSEWHGRKPKEILDVEETTQYNDTGVMLGTLEELGVLGVDSEGEFTQWTISFKKDRPILSSDLEQQNLEFVGGDQKLPLDSKYTTGKNEVTLGYVYCIVYETDKHHLEGSNGYAESYEHFFAEEYYKKLGYDVGQYPTSDDYFEEMLEEGIVEKAVRDDRLPMLVYDCQNCKLRLVGGKYEIKDVGIVD